MQTRVNSNFTMPLRFGGYLLLQHSQANPDLCLSYEALHNNLTAYFSSLTFCTILPCVLYPQPTGIVQFLKYSCFFLFESLAHVVPLLGTLFLVPFTCLHLQFSDHMPVPQGGPPLFSILNHMLSSVFSLLEPYLFP